MDFGNSGTFAGPPPEAYERLLLDVILGDQSLFTRIDFVLNSWKFVTNILDTWKEQDIRPCPTQQAPGARPRPSNCSSATASAGENRRE